MSWYNKTAARAPGEDSDGDSSEEENGTVRTHRLSIASMARRPKFSIVSCSPSPRVSTVDGPSTSIFEKHDTIAEEDGEEEEEEYNIRRATIVRIVGTILIILTILLSVVVIYMATKTPEIQYCHHKDSDHVTPRDMNNPDVFDDLTPMEYSAVNNFMLNNKELGITPWESADVNSSYILLIDLFLPNKDDAIQYIDHKSKKPIRKAKVVVVHGNSVPPHVQEYIVHPLPRPESVTPYKNPAHRRDPIPYASRPMDAIDYKCILPLVNKITDMMYPLLMQSYGLCYHNCTKGKNCLEIFDVAPRGSNSGERKTWGWAFSSADGFYLHPLGLEFLINHVSIDVKQWFVEMIVYNGQAFNTVESLMTAYRQNTLVMIHDHDYLERPLYSSYEARGNVPEKPKQGPKLVEPEGKRFDVNGQHVSYNNWEFNYHMRPSSGLQLFNVKFHGTRIAYEISLQEVLVFYTGYGPTQSSTNYYDISWFLGASSMELARGVDCPDTAVFLDTYFWANSGKAEKFKNNVCIFENNGNIPLRRHYANDFNGGYSFYGGIPDHHLVIRTIANIWNYDYIFDYIFYTNGAIQVKASATGYVQATFKLPNEDIRYGGAIHEHVMADLHQHVFNYKVDLDIAGKSNRFSVLDVGLENVKSAWFNNSMSTKMIINRNLVVKESKVFKSDATVPQYHIIHNTNAKNQFGADRSYRILNKSPVPFPLADSPTAASAQWARYPIIVTQRKDTELDSTTIYAQNDPWDPILDFNDFLDDESLVDEDLVAWVTIGTHHIPGTEDVPSTPTTWNQYSFFLNPHNYFTECPSVESADTVVIRPNENGKTKTVFETFGRSFESKCIHKAVGPYEYDGTRK